MDLTWSKGSWSTFHCTQCWWRGSPAGQYLRVACGIFDPFSPFSCPWTSINSGKEIVEKDEGWKRKERRVFGFSHSLLLKPSVFIIISVSRPHRFRACAPLWSKLWDVCLAQLEGSLTASSWGVGREPSDCSWEEGSRSSIWVISAARCAPSVVNLAADPAGEKTGA